MLRLVKPGMSPDVASLREGQPVASMHDRFEVNFIVNKITGRRPQVRILEIAWQDKTEHIRGFLLDYYARHHCLPLGPHDLGSTPTFHLSVGVIDFSEVRRRVREDQLPGRRGWRRRLLSIFRH